MGKFIYYYYFNTNLYYIPIHYLHIQGSNHPRAVQTVEKYKEQLSIFIESKGGRKPGILYIITLLSQPFRRYVFK